MYHSPYNFKDSQVGSPLDYHTADYYCPKIELTTRLPYGSFRYHTVGSLDYNKYSPNSFKQNNPTFSKVNHSVKQPQYLKPFKVENSFKQNSLTFSKTNHSKKQNSLTSSKTNPNNHTINLIPDKAENNLKHFKDKKLSKPNNPTPSKVSNSKKQLNNPTSSKVNHSIKQPINLNSPKVNNSKKQSSNPIDNRNQSSKKKVPLDSQKGTNGGQAVPIYQSDSQVGTDSQDDLPPHTYIQKDSQIGSLDSQKGHPNQIIPIANTMVTSWRTVGQSSSSNTFQLENTPKITGKAILPKKLFEDQLIQNTGQVIGTPKDIDLEVLLINSCKITATKVQTIVNSFIEGKKHTVIFCMTETKVDSHDFQPIGITIFSAHRSRKEIKDKKKGRGSCHWLCL